MAFIFQQPVLFKYCDPAGLVFYPRYFEMINDCVEAFFGIELRCSFVEIHKTGSVPTAEISARFQAPSRHGDALELRLRCSKIGRASLGLDIKAVCQDETRFSAHAVLVYVGTNGRPESWPDPLRTALQIFKKDQN